MTSTPTTLAARDQRLAEKQAVERARTARYLEAVRDTARYLPDLCDADGRPCTFAVWALLRLRGPGRTTTADAVRRERNALLAAHEARHGHNPVELDVDGLLPGESSRTTAGHLATDKPAAPSSPASVARSTASA